MGSANGFAGLPSTADIVGFPGVPNTTSHAAPSLHDPDGPGVPVWLTLPHESRDCGIVYFHGNGETRASAWGAAAKVGPLADATGCNVASFDYPGFGDNLAAAPTAADCVAAGAAVVAWLARRMASEGGKLRGDAGGMIAVWAHSLGSAVALMLSAGLGAHHVAEETGGIATVDTDGDGTECQGETVAAAVAGQLAVLLHGGMLVALVLESPLASVARVAAGDWLAPLLDKYLLSNEHAWRSVDRAPLARCATAAISVVHGDLDRICPVNHGEDLHSVFASEDERCTQATQSRLQRYALASHRDLFRQPNFEQELTWLSDQFLTRNSLYRHGL